MLFRVKNGFQAHIAGLRGVAIGLVLLNHLGVPGFSSGFIGVDIFFVISGFLITGIMAREYEANREEARGFGWISLKLFYLRRAKRILPASILVSVSTLAYAFFTMNSFGFAKVLKDFWFATFFGANLNFLQQSTNYFQQTEAPSPFQHYWSLSVEEQFYFLWPAVFLMAASLHFLHFRGRRVPWRMRAITVTSIVTVSSLIWMIVDFIISPNSAYFSLTTRGWELGLGALFALCTPYLNELRNQRLLALAGVTAVTASLFVVTQNNFGYTLILAVLGSALLLSFGGTIPRAANPLTWVPLIFLGNISYSLYLWHWPILTFAKNALGSLSPLSLGIVSAASIALACISYLFVEQPLLRLPNPEVLAQDRDFRIADPRPLRSTIWLTTSFVLITVLSLSSQITAAAVNAFSANKVAPFESVDPTPTNNANPLATLNLSAWSTNISESAIHLASGELNQVEKASLASYLSIQSGSWMNYGSWSCTNPLSPMSGVQRCTIGNPKGANKIFLMGDSHAQMYSGAFTKIAESRKDVFVISWTFGQCPNSLSREGIRTQSEVTLASILPECAYFHDHLLDKAAEDIKDAIAILSDAPPANLPLYRKGNIALLSALKSTAKSVYSLGSSPSYGSAQSCLNRDLSNSTNCGGRLASSASSAAIDAAESNTNFIPTAPWFCFQGACPLFIADTLVSVDGGHITPAFSRLLVPLILKSIGLG
jgi:peptidoglycan/LPS O-acetylase OafA/YrhL